MRTITDKLWGCLIAALLVVGLVTGIYAKGRIDANHAKEISQLQSELNTAQVVIKSEREAHEADTKLAAEQKAVQDNLLLKNNNLQDYINANKSTDNECLTGADTDKLLDLWQ